MTINTAPSRACVKVLQRRSAAAQSFLVAIAIGFVAHQTQAQVFTTQGQPLANKPERHRAPRARRTEHTSPRRTDTPGPQTPSSFSDPGAYCALVRDADSRDGRYVGVPLPPWIAHASGSGDVANQRAASWRCASGRVLACSETAGQNLCAKASSSRTPTPDIQNFCKGKRNTAIPADVAGISAPVWACRRGAPEIIGENAGVGPDGYLTANWRDVTDFAPANSVGAVPRSYLGLWAASVNGVGFIFKVPYAVQVRVIGGAAGKPIGTVQYANAGHVNCVTKLTLRGIEGGALIVDETITAAIPNVNETPSTLCPAEQNATLLLRDGRMDISWRKNDSPKIRMSGSFQKIQ